jgi:hypothetical protein
VATRGKSVESTDDPRNGPDAAQSPRARHRDFFDAEIVSCPDETVVGKSFGDVGGERGGLHPVDAFLELMSEGAGEDVSEDATRIRRTPGVDAINTFRVITSRFTSFDVVSRGQIQYFRSSRGFMRLVRFPAALHQESKGQRQFS